MASDSPTFDKRKYSRSYRLSSSPNYRLKVTVTSTDLASCTRLSRDVYTVKFPRRDVYAFCTGH